MGRGGTHAACPSFMTKTVLAIVSILGVVVGCSTQVVEEPTSTVSTSLTKESAPDPGGDGSTSSDTVRPPTSCEAKCLETRISTHWCSEYCVCMETFKLTHYQCEKHASSVAIDI